MNTLVIDVEKNISQQSSMLTRTDVNQPAIQIETTPRNNRHNSRLEVTTEELYTVASKEMWDLYSKYDWQIEDLNPSYYSDGHFAQLWDQLTERKQPIGAHSVKLDIEKLLTDGFQYFERVVARAQIIERLSLVLSSNCDDKLANKMLKYMDGTIGKNKTILTIQSDACLSALIKSSLTNDSFPTMKHFILKTDTNPEDNVRWISPW
ncbi:hypothetical protein BGZ76_005027 [Entomortierella beljakovae]|nr:hypothetical protein BGZ76_005027 [Entomortierella beljakovae]